MESLERQTARFLGIDGEESRTYSRNIYVVFGGSSEGRVDGSGYGFGSSNDGAGDHEGGGCGAGFACCGSGNYWMRGRCYMEDDDSDSGYIYAGAGEGNGTGIGYGDCWELKYSMPDAPTPGIKAIQGRPVHYVDVLPIANNYPLVFEGFRDDFAIVRILRSDLSFSPPCYLTRVGGFFALGKDPHLAHELAAKRHLDATTPKPKEEIHWNPDDPNDLPF